MEGIDFQVTMPVLLTRYNIDIYFSANVCVMLNMKFFGCRVVSVDNQRQHIMDI